ncbi:MAG: DUF2058 family protein, partial [Arenimonas sp.]
MSNSLRDQMLGLGFKAAPKPEKKIEAKPSIKPEQKNRQGNKPNSKHSSSQSKSYSKPATKSQEEIDLAKAYALRFETEKQERIAAEMRKQEEARLKRELKQKVQAQLKDKAQNVESAEYIRHFEYNGKIRRVYVTQEQLSELNKGALGLVQLDGRYLIVDSALAQQIKDLLPSIVALLIDP